MRRRRRESVHADTAAPQQHEVTQHKKLSRDEPNPPSWEQEPSMAEPRPQQTTLPQSLPTGGSAAVAVNHASGDDALHASASDDDRVAYLQYLKMCMRQQREPAPEVVEMGRAKVGRDASLLSLQIRTAEEQLGIQPAPAAPILPPANQGTHVFPTPIMMGSDRGEIRG